MLRIKSLLIITVLSIILGAFIVSSCTHEDAGDVIIPPSEFEYGKDKVSTNGGYSFDQGHSGLQFETAYLGTSALFSGRFNNFTIDIDFDQEDLPNSSVFTKVILSSVNTGSPGRDAGCLLGTFGTDVSDSATFVSTVIEEDGNGGYTIMGDMTFHGVTSSVSGTLDYIGTTFFDEASGIRDAPLNVAGFTVTLEMKAKSIFLIESSNIGDLVVIRGNATFKQPL